MRRAESFFTEGRKDHKDLVQNDRLRVGLQLVARITAYGR
jgi:hypothetical protein